MNAALTFDKVCWQSNTQYYDRIPLNSLGGNRYHKAHIRPGNCIICLPKSSAKLVKTNQNLLMPQEAFPSPYPFIYTYENRCARIEYARSGCCKNNAPLPLPINKNYQSTSERYHTTEHILGRYLHNENQNEGYKLTVRFMPNSSLYFCLEWNATRKSLARLPTSVSQLARCLRAMKNQNKSKGLHGCWDLFKLGVGKTLFCRWRSTKCSVVNLPWYSFIV